VSSQISLGTESFTSTPGTNNGSVNAFNDPLTQGVASSPNNYFPSGVSIPATFQSNVGDPNTINPRGVNGLAYYNDIGGSFLYLTTASDSMDIIPTNSITAVSWYQRDLSSGTITVRIYGTGTSPIDTHTISGFDNFVGVEASAGERITRVNVSNNSTTSTFGFDYVSMFSGIFLYDNKGDFDTAASGLNCLGTEDFENSTISSPSALAFDDSLTQSAANGPYPSGLALPVTIQSNNSGGHTGTSPRGKWGLAQAEAGFAGLSSAGILANYAVDGLDLIMLTQTIQAVSFNTIGYAADTVEVFFYDINGTYLGKGSRDSNIEGSGFVGFIAEEGEFIGRVHILSQNDLQQGIDNLRVYVPEPATLILTVAGLPVLLKFRRRRGSLQREA